MASLARARRSERRMSEIAERLERDRYELLDLSRALRGQPPAHEDNQAEEPPCRLEPEPEPEFPSDTGDTDAESTHRIPEPGEDHPSVVPEVVEEEASSAEEAMLESFLRFTRPE